ncbi:MAG: SpaA isopeptide-forming pilin-related protein [Geobacteraceae bacterium]|nr:SpaA isopeptide-forming pilin-related protein [Geobacteraceae bacterium]
MKRLFTAMLLLFSLHGGFAHADDLWTGALWKGTIDRSSGVFVPNMVFADWISTGTGNATGLGPIGIGSPPKAVVGQKFTLRFQSYLGAINGADRQIIVLPGLNSSFEYTVIAQIPCEITSIVTVDTRRTQYYFRAESSGKIYILNSASNKLTNGTGFDDGDIVAQFNVPAGAVNNSIIFDTSTGKVVTGRMNLVTTPTTIAAGNPANPSFLNPADAIRTLNLDSTLISPTFTPPTAYFSNGAIFPTFNPGPNDLNLKMDAYSSFGSRCTGRIGDVVWNDQNGNGIQDVGEPGIDGAKVTLKSTTGIPIAIQTTGVNLNQHGYYQFKGLCAGDYTIEVDAATVPAGYTPSRSFETGDASLDSNGSPAAVTLATDGSSDQTVDFGYVPPSTCQGSIGDNVWHDANRNGLQDEAGIEGIDNVSLKLYDNISGLLLATTTTGPVSGSPQGYYQFTNLCAGQYQVVIDAATVPAGFTPATSPNGADPALDSDASPAIVTLPSNTSSDQSVDFGYLSPCSGVIGNLVWHDSDRSGLQDQGEAGIDGVTVRLYNQEGTLLGTATTNPEGIYQFPGLCAGTYSVAADESTLPAGYTPTTSGVGADRATDSNGSPAAVTLADDAGADLGIDFGYLSPCTGIIGDIAWEDMNGNGIQDLGEPGIALVMVNLKDLNTNAILKTAATDANGWYQFTGVCSGDYKVELSAPNGYVLTTANAPGSTPDNDSNPNPAPVSLATDAGSDLSLDFGLYRPVALGDFVWEDLNGDGIQDGGEAGIAGVNAELYRYGEATLLAATGTDQGGNYLFDSLLPGSYQVRFSAPAGYLFTLKNAGNSSIDSNPEPATGLSDSITLVSGQQPDLTIDAGLYRTASIGDRVWSDGDNNGVPDGGEAGLNGWTVTLKQGAAVVATTVTAGDGNYAFTGLAPDSYTVCTTPMAGYLQSYDLDGLATQNCATASVASGENRTDADFGYLLSQPAVTIVKQTNGVDAPVAPGPYINVGAAVNWTYLVTNSGNVPLAGVTVSDSMGLAVTCPQNTLAAGAAMTCTASGTATIGQYENIGYVTGRDPLDAEVTSQYASHYFGQTPAVAIVKKTNGIDAPVAPGPYAAVGSTVSWSYEVSNSGNVPLTGVAVSDSMGVAVSCPQTTLAPAEAMSCSGSGIAVAGQYENIGYATGKDPNNADVTSQYASHYFGPAPAIAIVKKTNGVDAPTAPGPYVAVGAPVTWSYEVSNSGNVPLTGVTVSDSQGVTVTCPQNTLAAGAAMTCTASGTAVIDQYQNIGYATGRDPLNAEVTSQYASHYFGMTPSIYLVKKTNGIDAPTAPGPGVEVGSTVTWTYDVTNTGNVPLTGVTVSDSMGVAVTCPQSTLAVDAAMTCTGSGIAVANQYENIGYVVGKDPNNGDVTSQYASHYNGQAGGRVITIVKKTNGVDAPGAPGPYVAVGSTVNWTYLVTNTGTSTLTSVVVTDSKGVTVSCPATSLAAGASMTCTASGTAVAGQYENIGYVTALNGLKNVVDQYPSHYFATVPSPAVAIVKKTNGYDAPSATDRAMWPYIEANSTVRWTYEVSNPGNVPLTDVTVTDSKGVTVTCPRTTLAVGASMVCTASGAAVAGPYENIGTVTAKTPTNDTLASQYASHYATDVHYTVTEGDSASVGWWGNNGQTLIAQVNGGGSSTLFGTWLATNYPNLFGSLNGQTNDKVAAFFNAFKGGTGNKEAQIMGVAMAAYVSNYALAGTLAASTDYKYRVPITNGIGILGRTFLVGSTVTGPTGTVVETDGIDAGLTNGVSYSVEFLLSRANELKAGGAWSAKALTSISGICSAINQQGHVPK